jgi:hypothetical protein
MTNLVLIEGSTAARFVEGKFSQKAEIDYNQSVKDILASIEYFRMYGIDFEEEENSSEGLAKPEN